MNLLSQPYNFNLKIIISYVVILVFCNTSLAQITNYNSLDKTDPISYHDNYIVYQKDTITLGPKSFFIDGQLSDAAVSKLPFVFNSVNEAAKHLTNGTETSPMTLYIAPYVYWIDNPDDPEIRTPKNGSIPFGLEISCDWLTFKGLSKDPSKVVLACNRGQTIGAKGNFTMFHFDGEGTSSEYITFGNYCNVDLEYPLKPELNRKKRASAIVQAQLIICNGDKIVARHTRFISRLNLCPFVGGKRVFFENCHFESTDDALCGTGIYKNCSLEFFSSKPFYHTTGTGAVFLGCNVKVHTQGTQYFTKANGQLAVINTTFSGNNLQDLAWCDELSPTTKNYQYHITVNQSPFTIGKNNPEATVNLNQKSLLNAYLFNYKGQTIYNTYNLLSGVDQWDPERLKPKVSKAEKLLNKTLTNIPIQLKLSPNKGVLETNTDSLQLKAELFRFGSVLAKHQPVSYVVSEAQKHLVNLKASEFGETCLVIPTNFSDIEEDIRITAKTASGLEGSCFITVHPPKLAPPTFKTLPKIINTNLGTLKASYTFNNTTHKDESKITWYRCKDKSGSDPLKIAVSRLDEPLKTYALSTGDIGSYILVKIEPKQQRSDTGKVNTFLYPKKIAPKDIRTNLNEINTDFIAIPTENQPKIIPGSWTFTPLQNDNASPKSSDNDAWFYGEGRQGSANQFGLLQTGRTASLSYTPLNTEVKDIKLSLVISPFKTAGQGFSVAPLYMDIVVNFDPKTKTGYGLRFIRTTKYGNAVDCYFVAYKNNNTVKISDPVTISCFRTQCHITLQLKDNILHAKAYTNSKYPKNKYPSEVKSELDIQTTIEPLPFNSFGIEYNGGSSTMINSIKAEAQGLQSKP